MNQIKRIDTVFVPVLDVKKAEKWYMELFPFEVIFRSGGYVGFRFTTSDTPHTALTLYEAEEVPNASHAAFNFYVEEIDRLYDAFQKKNIEVSEIHAHGELRFFRFYDPSGNLLEAVTF
ncbi:VOC family protein [Halobacillus fulvus]|nr:VOC family protein [Halobacillus fulvus]